MKNLFVIGLILILFACASQQKNLAPIEIGMTPEQMDHEHTLIDSSAKLSSKNGAMKPISVQKAVMNKFTEKPEQVATISDEDNVVVVNNKANAKQTSKTPLVKNNETAKIASTSKTSFIAPLKSYTILQKFNSSSKGVDLKAVTGSAVLASGDGVVAYSGSALKAYGNLIIIKHPNGYLTAYGGNKSNLVKEGQSVVQGEKIAEIGNENGIHKLHFELRKGGSPLDPFLLIK